MAEWLRRLARNQMGSTRAGSNPADCDFFTFEFEYVLKFERYKLFGMVKLCAVMAKWLRRLTRNQMGSTRAGCRILLTEIFFTFEVEYVIKFERYKLFGMVKQCAVMAEWLRRLTRNQMGSTRAGSNPADCDFFYI